MVERTVNGQGPSLQEWDTDPCKAIKPSMGCKSSQEGTSRGLLGWGFLKVDAGFETDAGTWVKFLQILK